MFPWSKKHNSPQKEGAEKDTATLLEELKTCGGIISIVKHPQMNQLFREHLLQQGSCDNLDFIERCLQLRDLEEQTCQVARSIFATHISNLADRPVQFYGDPEKFRKQLDDAVESILNTQHHKMKNKSSSSDDRDSVPGSSTEPGVKTLSEIFRGTMEDVLKKLERDDFPGFYETVAKR